jgi:hypothetical protein
MFERDACEGRSAWRCWLTRDLCSWADAAVTLLALSLLLVTLEAFSTSCCRSTSMRLRGRILSKKVAFGLNGTLGYEGKRSTCNNSSVQPTATRSLQGSFSRDFGSMGGR